MSYGKGLTIGYWGRISVSGKLIIGDNVTIGDFVQIEAHSKVEIGDNVLVASRVFISDTSHGDYSEVNEMNFYEAPNLRELSSKEDILGITFGLEKMYVYCILQIN